MSCSISPCISQIVRSEYEAMAVQVPSGAFAIYFALTFQKVRTWQNYWRLVYNSQPSFLKYNPLTIKSFQTLANLIPDSFGYGIS